MNFVDELKWRGMLHDLMPGTEELLKKEMVKGYIGFDPTADSLGIHNVAEDKAALGWIGLLKWAQGDQTPIGDRIIGCWKDLSAQTPQEVAAALAPFCERDGQPVVSPSVAAQSPQSVPLARPVAQGIAAEKDPFAFSGSSNVDKPPAPAGSAPPLPAGVAPTPTNHNRAIVVYALSGGGLGLVLLGILFLFLASAGTFLMYKLWGYPFDHDTHRSAAPRYLMRIHRQFVKLLSYPPVPRGSTTSLQAAQGFALRNKIPFVSSKQESMNAKHIADIRHCSRRARDVRNHTNTILWRRTSPGII